MIRVPLAALLAAAGFWTIDHIPASARTGISQYPFCIQGMDNPGWSGCSFNSLATCQASASGTDAECLANPLPTQRQRCTTFSSGSNGHGWATSDWVAAEMMRIFSR